MKLRNALLAALFALSLILPTLFGAQATYAGAVTYTQVTTVPFNASIFACGQFIQLSGTIHSVDHFTIDEAGGVHVMSENNPQGVSGTAFPSGATYHGVGVTRENFNARVGSEYTFVNRFLLIGEGRAPNYYVSMTQHYTINANGELTAYVDNFSVECK